jgi:tetratricopeptide (TPR) repeat protein
MLLVPGLAVAAFLLPVPASRVHASLHDVTESTHAEALEHYRAGLEELRAESFREAATDFKAATRLDPFFVMAYYYLGQARMSLHRYSEAVQAFLACREAHHELTSLRQLSQSVADEKRADEVRTLRDLIWRSQGTGDATRAFTLERRLQRLQSDEHRGVTSMETPAAFSLALGSAYFRSGHPADAEREYREAIRVNSKLGEAHNNLAIICFLTGRLDEAEKEMKAAERAGFAVNPRFKDDLKKAEKVARR